MMRPFKRQNDFKSSSGHGSNSRQTSEKKLARSCDGNLLAFWLVASVPGRRMLASETGCERTGSNARVRAGQLSGQASGRCVSLSASRRRGQRRDEPAFAASSIQSGRQLSDFDLSDRRRSASWQVPSRRLLVGIVERPFRRTTRQSARTTASQIHSAGNLGHRRRSQRGRDDPSGDRAELVRRSSNLLKRSEQLREASRQPDASTWKDI